jgi:TPR repeat protein
MRLHTIIVLVALGTSGLRVEAQCKPDTIGGNPQLQWSLGMFYERNKNYSAALTCFRMSAEQGDVGSQEMLGWMYSHGEGVSQDYTLALGWYMKVAQQSDHAPNCGTVPHARAHVAMAYFEGEGVPKDEVEAYKWYVLAGAIDEAGYVMNSMTVAQVVEAQKRLNLWRAEHQQIPSSTCE